MSARFANQKLIVVGGTSGMGKAVARILLEEGGRAVVIGHRDDKLQAAVAELAASGPVEGLRADIASGTERQALVAQLQKDHADATLLVNAAGVFLPKAFLEHEERDYDLYLDINKALFFITQAVARSMVALRKGGSDCQHWLDVGQAGHPGHSILGLFDGQGRTPLADAAPGDGAGRTWHPRQCCFARGRRDPHLRRLHPKGAGSRCAPGVQRVPSTRPRGPRRGCCADHRPSVVGRDFLGHRRNLGCRRRRHGWTQQVQLTPGGAPRPRLLETCGHHARPNSVGGVTPGRCRADDARPPGRRSGACDQHRAVRQVLAVSAAYAPGRRGDSRHVGDVLRRGARLSGRSLKRCHSRRQARHIPE